MTNEKIYTNEILNDNELDKVAGGTIGETYQGAEYLHKCYGVSFSGGDSKEKLYKLFSKVNISFIAHDNAENEYCDMFTGQKIGRGVALDQAGRNFEQSHGPLTY